MYEIVFLVREIRGKRIVFSAYFSGYDKGGSGKEPSQVGSRRQNIYSVFLWCLPPTPHLLLYPLFFLFSFFFLVVGSEVMTVASGAPFRQGSKIGNSPLEPSFPILLLLDATHRKRSVPNRFFLQAFVLCSHSKFAQSRLKCTRSLQ